MKVKSNVTGITYSSQDVVRIVNPKQAAAYMFFGAPLIDVYASLQSDKGSHVLVFLFNRADTQELYQRWCNHELGDSNE
ncbi:hypothetical protein SAMN05216391_108119 [Lachnospiraceae bacterium KHCPX20]|nr:hypothetical protein SAMN05216391_108119 [Lachnospiraceae bacterium KHCPX20]